MSTVNKVPRQGSELMFGNNGLRTYVCTMYVMNESNGKGK
jgi:hypothetical protein